MSFFVAFLGGALRPGSGSAQAIAGGVLALLPFGFALMQTSMSATSASQRERSAPWVALASYALLGAAVTAPGRHLLGDDYAIESHYEAISVFLPLATIGVVATSWAQTAGQVRRAWLTACAALLILTIGVDAHGSRYIRQFAAERQAEVPRAFLGSRRPINACPS